jgi:hypothetical protein
MQFVDDHLDMSATTLGRRGECPSPKPFSAAPPSGFGLIPASIAGADRWLPGVFVPLFDATSSDQAEGTVTASYSISLWVLI